MKEVNFVKQARRVAIMQPYFFPYLGYFQLIFSSDCFVFYDDVNFIKGGWINRNRILCQGKVKYLTANVVGASSYNKINKINVGSNKEKIFKTVEQSYKKAPYFKKAIVPIQKTLESEVEKISDLAKLSITNVVDYLGIKREFKTSSIDFPCTQEFNRADRLIEITKLCSGSHYINLPGGRKLYDAGYFQASGVTLSFLEPCFPHYSQYGLSSEPGLSIIDILMHNPPEIIYEWLSQFEERY